MSPTGPPMPESIGKYRLLESIGRGGMGLIFKAHDPILDRLVALKVISPDVEVTEELLARFFREAKACAKLNHPNIVTVYDMGEDAGRLFIVMELLEGQDLRHLIRGPTPLTLEDKLSVILQVCQGLHYAHRNGVVHRDMKPGNIFLRHGGGVKILDFGIAHIDTTGAALTRAGLVMGTLRYIAPEQLRGRADHRSDMFSVGAVFYEFLTARLPFQGGDPVQLLEQIRTEDPPPVTDLDPTVPPELAAIVHRAMRKDPLDRFRDLDEMRVEIQAVRDRMVEDRPRVIARVRRQRERVVELRAALDERVDTREVPAAIPAITESSGVVAVQAAERELSGMVEALEARLARVQALAPAMQRARALMDGGRVAAAAAVFESIVGAMPEHRAAREGLADARLRLEREAHAADGDATVPVPGAAPDVAEKPPAPSWRIRWPIVAITALALASGVAVAYWRPARPPRDPVVAVPQDTAGGVSSTVDKPAARESVARTAADGAAGKVTAERTAAEKAAAKIAADRAAADQAAAQKATAERAIREKAAAEKAAGQAAAERAVAEKAAAEQAAADSAISEKAAAERAAAQKAAEKAAAEKAAAEKAEADRAAAEKMAAEKLASEKLAAERAAAKAAADKAAADQAAAEKVAAANAAADRAAPVKGRPDVAVAVPPSSSLGRFGSDGRGAIQQALDELRRAYAAKDVALVRRIRPKLRADDLSTLRHTFDNAATYTLDLKVETIEMRGNEAQARVFRQDVIVAKDGQIHRSQARVTIRLQRVQDRWTIDDIR